MKSEINEIVVTFNQRERENVLTAIEALIRGDETINTLSQDQIDSLNDLWEALENCD